MKCKAYRYLLLSFLLAVIAAFCGCTQNNSNQELVDKLIDTAASLENREAFSTSEPIAIEESALTPTLIPQILTELKVHFIDVGQGDCILITCGGEAMLIDAGGSNKGTAIQLYLQKQNITELTYVIGTHLDADHIDSMDVILYKFNCKTIMLPNCTKDTRTYDDVVQTMKSKYYNVTFPIVGEVYRLGDAEITIIAPNNYEYGDNDNNYSIGLILKHGENKFLFTGDAEKEAEEDIIKEGIDIDVDCYKVSHHGSSSSTSQEFLDALSPEFAVISCEQNNSYGHPHSETLAKLKAAGVKLFRTDEQGTIVASSDGTKISFSCASSENWLSGNEYSTEKQKESDKDNKTDLSDEDGSSYPISEEEGSSKSLTYILNTNTKKFHYPSCGSVAKIAEKNYKDFTGTREELLTMGYSSCGICTP